MTTEAKFWMYLCLLQALLSFLVIFTQLAHACEIEPGDWEAIQEEIADNGK